MNKKISLIAKWAVLLIVLFVMYAPILVIVIFSFSTAKEIGGADGFGSFTFGLYAKLLNDKSLIDALINTLIIGLVSATLATFIGTLTAIGIHYMRKMKSPSNIVTQITVVNAEIITAVGFLLLTGLFRGILENTPLADIFGNSKAYDMTLLIIMHTMITTPYVILAVSPRLRQLNPNLFEASLDLGASPTRSLFTVMVPQLVGAMISGFAIAFTLSFDDFVITDLNAGTTGIETLSTYVYNKLKQGGINPAIRALSAIIFGVVLLILIIINIVGRKKKQKQNK